MNKVLIALQGPLNSRTLNCAKTFLCTEFNVVMICWSTKKHIEIESESLKIDFIEDPDSIITKDGGAFINNMRQIISNRYILNKYGNEYDYIIKLRNDLKLLNRDLFLKQVSRAISKEKIWTININTTSPRIFTPVLLPYHISDWLFGGTPNNLKKYLQLEDIEEENLVAKKPSKFKNLVFWRNAQNEQAIWRISWDQNSTNNQPKLLHDKPWKKKSLETALEYASYLNQKFFVTALRESGLQSIKYKCNIKTWYGNVYNLFILNKIECFLLNNGLIIFLILYPPILRNIIYKLRFLISRNHLRF